MADVFVFGSNLAGRHGKGSALEAKNKWGAIYGMGVGRQGNSYAIPTKDAKLNVLHLNNIQYYVDEFLAYARFHRDDTFHIVAIGCGLAGYTPKQIAPMFDLAPSNCRLPHVFHSFVSPHHIFHKG